MSFHHYLIGIVFCLVLLIGLVEAGTFDWFIQ